MCQMGSITFSNLFLLLVVFFFFIIHLYQHILFLWRRNVTIFFYPFRLRVVCVLFFPPLYVHYSPIFYQINGLFNHKNYVILSNFFSPQPSTCLSAHSFCANIYNKFLLYACLEKLFARSCRKKKWYPVAACNKYFRTQEH